MTRPCAPQLPPRERAAFWRRLRRMARSLTYALCLGLLSGVDSGVATAQTLAPFPGAVELSPGQWVPCSHPLAVDAGRGCGVVPMAGPVTTPTPAARGFRPGYAYHRQADGQRIYVLALAVSADGSSVLLAECLNALGSGSRCLREGDVWVLPWPVSASGWLELRTTRP